MYYIDMGHSSSFIGASTRRIKQKKPEDNESWAELLLRKYEENMEDRTTCLNIKEEVFNSGSLGECTVQFVSAASGAIILSYVLSDSIRPANTRSYTIQPTPLQVDWPPDYRLEVAPLNLPEARTITAADIQAQTITTNHLTRD